MNAIEASIIAAYGRYVKRSRCAPNAIIEACVISKRGERQQPQASMTRQKRIKRRRR